MPGTREAFSVTIKGMDPFLRRLGQVKKPATRRRIIRRAMSAGTVPVKRSLRNQVKSAGAVRKKHLQRGVASVVRDYRSSVVVIVAGIKYHKTSDGENPGNYFHLVDLGVKPHSQETRPVHIDDLGEYRQRSGRGGSVHPGFYGRLIKRAAERDAWPKVFPAVIKSGHKQFVKALAKQGGR